jgi:hypothetical protein
MYIYVAYTLRKKLFKSVYLYYVAHLAFIEMFMEMNCGVHLSRVPRKTSFIEGQC